MAGASDTVFALSSGRPPAAIAVVRLSGPQAGTALQRVIGRLPEARRASLCLVRNPATGEVIDQALALWFPAPASETGEDMAELHLHGGRAVIAATLEALGALPGLRPAEAGEFTRRAFAAGQLDLTAVEGLADLIGAETEAQRRQAVRQLRGALGKRAEAWRRRLIELQALVEAGLDFSDEGDVPADLIAPVLRGAGDLGGEIRAVLADGRRGERLREGLTIAIAGPPNAGKSTLFNWLAGRPAAIVSPYPGTTRDVLELHLALSGYPVTVLDTAGMRASEDPLEQEGIARARAGAAAADLVLWVEEAGCAMGAPAQLAGEGAAPFWCIDSKADAPRDAGSVAACAKKSKVNKRFLVSAHTGEGLPGLLAALSEFAAEALSVGDNALITRARHRHALEQAAAALDEVMNHNSCYEELIAEDLRAAAAALGRLVGRIDVEDVLEVIFRDFCIGK